MTATTAITAEKRGAGAFLWYLCALLAVLSVLILNGRALFYFDTPGYVDQGTAALRQLHVVAPEAAGTAAGTAEGGLVAGAHTVDGSRSPFYSLLAGTFAYLGALEMVLAVNVAALFAAIWLIARQVQWRWVPDVSRAAVVSLPLIVASLGALPFYAAYLMPDLLAPVLILAIAGLTAFADRMSGWERLLAFVIGAVAIVSHLSHFAIGGLMLLAVLPVSWLLTRRFAWIGFLIVALIVGAAWAQGKAFRVMAAKAAKSEVVIKPYITARLIQDKVGYEWLRRHCPDPTIATCALWEALQRSDDPYRLTASHITFETSQRLGSFRLMTPEDQVRVANAQRQFFKDVLFEMPVATTLAFLKNTLIQTAMFSVDMTLPDQLIGERNADVRGSLQGQLAIGRLATETGWVPGVVTAQGALYAASFGFILAMLLLPGALPRPVRLFAVMVILGILANALVCGGISQPATRYGARVIWLLPLVATLLWMVSGCGREEERA